MLDIEKKPRKSGGAEGREKVTAGREKGAKTHKRDDAARKRDRDEVIVKGSKKIGNSSRKELSKNRQEGERKGLFGHKDAKRRNERVATLEDDDNMPIELVDDEEEVETRPQKVKKSVKLASFTTGLVDSSIKDITPLNSDGAEETKLLSAMLDEFSKSEPFIGVLSSRTQFISRRGGRVF